MWCMNLHLLCYGFANFLSCRAVNGGPGCSSMIGRK
jgi:hypothetical protein